MLAKARFAALSTQPDQPQPSASQFCNSLPKTFSIPEQRQLPNPSSDENEDELIPCSYDSRISYERVWDTNVPVMDHEMFKLHHPISMLVLEKVSL